MVEHDPSGTLFPLIPLSHQGGRIVLSDGKYRGTSAFLTIEDYEKAFDEAKALLCTGQIPALPVEPKQIPHLIDGSSVPLTSYEKTVSAIDELLSQLRDAMKSDDFILHSHEENITTFYLSSEQDYLIRHEHYSTIAAEVFESQTQSFRTKNITSTLPLAQYCKEVQEELHHWMRPKSNTPDFDIASGEYPCLMSEQVTGVFLHEVVGHLFEADTKVASKLADRRNGPIAPSFVSVGDHPVHLFDDEGTPTKNTWMIAEGKIESLLHSRETALRYRCAPTGHGRSLHGWFPPIPRMHRTYMPAGTTSTADLRQSFKRMIYLENAENAHSYLDNYVLHIGNAYLLENGNPIKSFGRVVVRGSCFKSLANIIALGDQTEPYLFTCYKKDQNGLHVSSLAPKVLFKSLWVGKK